MIGFSGNVNRTTVPFCTAETWNFSMFDLYRNFLGNGGTSGTAVRGRD